MFELILIIKSFLSVSRVFLTPAIKLSTQINKSKIVIRGTKDRPPQGVPEKGCHTGTEKSLINIGGSGWIAGLG